MAKMFSLGLKTLVVTTGVGGAVVTSVVTTPVSEVSVSGTVTAVVLVCGSHDYFIAS